MGNAVSVSHVATHDRLRAEAKTLHRCDRGGLTGCKLPDHLGHAFEQGNPKDFATEETADADSTMFRGDEETHLCHVGRPTQQISVQAAISSDSPVNLRDDRRRPSATSRSQASTSFACVMSRRKKRRSSSASD